MSIKSLNFIAKPLIDLGWRAKKQVCFDRKSRLFDPVIEFVGI